MNYFNYGAPVITLTRKVVLGNPKKDCDHLGICYVSDDDDPVQPVFRGPCPSVAARFSLNLFGQLQIFIPQGNLSAKQREKHFGADQFVIVEPFVFSPVLARALGHAGDRLTVRPGQYPWTETAGGIYLHLPLEVG